MMNPIHHCPACECAELRAFYDVRDIPVQSNLLVRDAVTSLNYPAWHVSLSVCQHCGFITNTLFDESRLMMSTDYEAGQGCSPTFTRFAQSLAAKWIERYDLKNKTIAEIGCGQGEFLEIICEMTGGQGIGFDPVIRRTSSESNPQLHFVQDVFDQKHLTEPVDFIICRHTLEHIANPLDFLRTVRASSGQAVVAIEVPDTVRVLKEGAFWDIYYEHNSYFTPASLQRTLLRAGFSPIHTVLEYDNQYLIIESTPAQPRIPSQVQQDELDVVDEFSKNFANISSRWQMFANEAKAKSQKAIVWGSGSKAVGFLTTLKLSDAFHAVVDINPAKQGTYLPGTALEIIGPDKLSLIRPEFVVIMNPIYEREITQQLHLMGLHPTILTL